MPDPIDTHHLELASVHALRAAQLMESCYGLHGWDPIYQKRVRLARKKLRTALEFLGEPAPKPTKE